VAVLVVVAVVLRAAPIGHLGFGVYEVQTYFPYFAGGWILCRYGRARELVDRPWLGPASVGLFLLTVWFWTRGAPPTWLSFAPGRVQNVLWMAYRYVTAGAGIAANVWLLLRLWPSIRRTAAGLSWLGRRTIDVYAAHGYFLVPVVVLLRPLGLPVAGTVAIVSAAALAGSLALSGLLLRRTLVTRRLLLGDWPRASPSRPVTGSVGTR
jgi:surface polysaccharide O-acyltransferase-like enzyme